jgi:hypothetical protein
MRWWMHATHSKPQLIVHASGSQFQCLHDEWSSKQTHRYHIYDIAEKNPQYQFKVTIVFQMLLTKKHKVIITHPCRQQQKNAGIFFNACNQHKRREEETLQWLKGQAWNLNLTKSMAFLFPFRGPLFSEEHSNHLLSAVPLVQSLSLVSLLNSDKRSWLKWSGSSHIGQCEHCHNNVTNQMLLIPYYLSRTLSMNLKLQEIPKTDNL